MNLIEVLSKPEVAVVISLVGLVLTIYGSIASFFSIKSFFQQKKYTNANKEILLRANQDWEGRYTQDEISNLNQELDKLSNAIAHDIPRQAKNAFLKYRLESLAEEIYRLYKEYQRVHKQINQEESIQGLDERIILSIHDEIEPRIYKKPKNFSLVVITIFLVFLSLPFGSDIVFRYLDHIIDITGAKLNLGHITSYFMLLILITYLMYYLNNNKLILMIIYKKKLTFLMSFLLLVTWMMFVYFISFNIFIRGYFLQLVVGIVSIVCFAISFKLIVSLIKQKYS